jgi:hypothetical protein
MRCGRSVQPVRRLFSRNLVRKCGRIGLYLSLLRDSANQSGKVSGHVFTGVHAGFISLNND